MEKKTLEIFFTAKFLKIPSYQRDYAWELQNVDDLFDDIKESIDTKTRHYIGTFILAKDQSTDQYAVVDGQQRLTTLTMLLNALIMEISNRETQIINRSLFIENGSRPKLTLLGRNDEYFRMLLSNCAPDPIDKSQARLKNAYEHIRQRVSDMKTSQPIAIHAYLENVKSLEVMEFIEEDAGKAIRIFQTVNDRGQPLTNMEKVKSLLIYFSNRFLNAGQDNAINNAFGKMYRCFNDIKATAENEDYGVQLISNKKFSEDNILRYHFLAYPNNRYDYKATADDVLDAFLKPTLKAAQLKLDLLANFISDYVHDLESFFEAFSKIIGRVKSNPKYHKLLVFLNPSTNLYPLMIRLEARGLLDSPVPENPQYSFFDILTTTDVRVYKTRGTNPEKDMAYLARDARTATPIGIKNSLRDFTERFMDDAQFKYELRPFAVGRNQALPFLLLELDEAVRAERGDLPHTISTLISLIRGEPTIEHVYSQTPTFEFPNRGFSDLAEYTRYVYSLGNLTIAEKSINSSCQNKTPENKAVGDSGYRSSIFVITKQVAAEIQNRQGNFGKQDIDKRTSDLIEFACVRFPLWK